MGDSTARAPVSCCFIVRDDEGSGLFVECLESIRPHVAEIVVVDTGSVDGTVDIARKYADVVEVFTDCNDPETGSIANFAMARNRSFDLATQPWVMWMDSDDVVAGGEHIARLVAMAEANKGAKDWCYLFPYEYVYAPNGRCVCLHYRERLLSRRAAMRWVNPVHEVLLPEDRPNLHVIPCDDVVFKHQRQRSKKPQVPGRNLRILQKLVETDGCEDPRHFYYLGLEYANAQQYDKAMSWLSRYFDVSGWDDEKAMAALKMSEILNGLNRHEEAGVWGHRAIGVMEEWGEGYFAIARSFYHRAIAGQKGGDVRRNWQRCAHFARVGLSMPPTKTMLFVNPLEREVDAHVYLTMAYSQLGDARNALKHAKEARKANPDDPNLVYNMRTFERAVAVDDVSAVLGRLVAMELLAPVTRDQVLAAINNGGGEAVGGHMVVAKPATYPRGVQEHHFPRAHVAPTPRSFSIPEHVDIDDLPVRMTDGQVEAATILLWKEMLLHDEVLAAERLLADAPYRVKHSPIIENALARTRRMTAWMDNAETEQKYNGPEDPTIENGVPIGEPLAGQLLDRSEMAIAGVEKGTRVLDLGCFDGGIVNRWALDGHDVTAVDLCETSIAMARRVAEKHKTGARFVCRKFDALTIDDLGSRLFDLVTSTDTYEHLRDPVKDMLRPARKWLRPGGVMRVCTPHGSWMRGEFVEWAHPWRWADDEGKSWNCDLPHAHLVAPTPWTVAANMRAAGFRVRDCYVRLNSVADVPGQGNVFCEAINAPAPAVTDGSTRLDIVFACGDAWQAWNPEIMRAEGIGGSETMVVHMARRLAALGHRVRVYTSTGPHGDGIFDGVEYRQTEHLLNAGACDVFVAWRNAALFDAPVVAGLRLLWVHDIFAGGGAHKNLLRADRVLALSQWHAGFVVDHHNLPKSQVLVTRNGIDFSRFTPRAEIVRDPHRAVYSSSPDRGLAVLLQVWPKIRERVPDASLDVYYGFFNWRKAAEARKDTEQLQVIDALEQMLVDLAPHGVRSHGRVDQATLADAFMGAGVWAYPTWFSETSCITAMEAQAAGLRIVTSSIAALNETVGAERHAVAYNHAGYGVLIDGDWMSDEYQARFVDEVVRAMTAPEGEWLKTREEIKARAFRDFDLDELAEAWVEMMRAMLAEMHVHPLVPYQPRADFVRKEVA